MDTNTTTVILHVGIIKTATTTLQNHLFSKHSQILCLGKPYLNDCVRGFLRRICTLDGLDYDIEKEKVIFEKKIALLSKNQNAKHFKTFVIK